MTDLISRADVLEGLKHSTAYLHDDIYTIVNRIPSAEATGALDEAITKYVADGYMLPPNALSALPSAEAVQGEWIADEDFHGIVYKCSNCGRICVSAVSYDIEGNKWQYNFCPNCGARMKGADHETD